MKEKIKIVVGILILIILLIMHFSYALYDDETSENEIVELNCTEISTGEILKIQFALSKVEYEKFKIQLYSNDIKLEEINIKDNANFDVETTADNLIIEINKNIFNFENITLNYKIPDNLRAGDIINFNIKILAVEEKNNEEIQAESENESQIDTNEVEILNENKKIVIVEKNEQENDKGIEEYEKKSSNNKQETDDTLKETENNMNKNQEKSNTPEITSQKKTNQSKSSNESEMSSQVKSIVYKGSNNNYLSNLEIDGKSLNTTFNKEKTTYFIKLKNTNLLKVTAIAEESKARICITGNENLQTGQNKILISVTAENGNVRYYRIYVTIEEE